MSGSTSTPATPTPANTSFVRRRIDVMLTLGQGGAAAQPGPGNAGDTVTARGLRVSAQISKVGGNSQGTLALRVYGMSESTMNKFSAVGGLPVVVQSNNVVTVLVGDDAQGMNVVYQGTIGGAFIDYNASPAVAFVVTGLAALQQAIVPVPATSYRGGADVAGIMATLAKNMGFKFENGGVAGLTLADPYFPGTAYEQAERCAQHAGIHMFVDDGTLAIWPAGGARAGSIPLISPQTGMKGYPTMNNLGPVLETLYNPSIRFGAQVKIESRVRPACGMWQVIRLQHNLESEVPDGAWFSHLETARPGYVAN